MAGSRVPAWATAPQDSGRLFLTARADGDSSPQSWCVDRKAAYLLGRNGQEVEVFVNHKSVSRFHCCLAHHREGHLYLLDLGSVHGTRVNGNRMEKGAKIKLQPGDQVQLAACPTVFEMETGKSAAELRQSGGGLKEAAAELDSQHSSQDDLASSRPSTRWRDSRSPSREPAARSKDADAPRELSAVGRGVRQPLDDSGKRRHAADRPAARRHRTEMWSGGKDGSQQSRQDSHRRHSADRRLTDGGSRRPGDARSQRHDGLLPRQVARSSAPGQRRRQPSPIPRRHSPARDRKHGRRSRSPDGTRRSHSPKRTRHEERSRATDEAAVPQQQQRQTAFSNAPAAANSPLDIVRLMMGGPGNASGMNAEQKKKLLWGGKKAAAPEPGLHPSAAHAGANRWDTAALASDADTDKFHRLMGVKRVATAASELQQQASTAETPLFDREVLPQAERQRVLGQLESQFLEGVRRGNKHTVGLGL